MPYESPAARACSTSQLAWRSGRLSVSLTGWAVFQAAALQQMERVGLRLPQCVDHGRARERGQRHVPRRRMRLHRRRQTAKVDGHAIARVSGHDDPRDSGCLAAVSWGAAYPAFHPFLLPSSRHIEMTAAGSDRPTLRLLAGEIGQAPTQRGKLVGRDRGPVLGHSRDQRLEAPAEVVGLGSERSRATWRRCGAPGGPGGSAGRLQGCDLAASDFAFAQPRSPSPSPAACREAWPARRASWETCSGRF